MSYKKYSISTVSNLKGKMATIVKTPSGTWKALIRKQGWPTTSKTFRTKRDAEDWSRRVEDEMVRGVFITRSPSERMTFDAALKRYMSEVSSTKKLKTQSSEAGSAKHLEKFFGKYSLAAISSELVASYRDQRLPLSLLSEFPEPLLCNRNGSVT